MSQRKAKGRSRTKPVDDYDGPWRYEGGELVRPNEREQVFDFGNSSVLMTHPSLNHGETISGTFAGNWGTVPTGRSSFAITGIHAQLVLPEISAVLPGRSESAQVQPGSIYLSKNTFDVPAYLADIYPAPNCGVLRTKERFYSAVFGMHLVFPFAYADGLPLELNPASVLLRTTWYIERDGSLIASGIGTIIDGFLKGLMLACGHPSKKPKKPPKCDAMKPGSTWMCTNDAGHLGKHANAYSGNIWD